MDSEEKKQDIISKVRLKDSDDNGEFRPFVVNYNSNPALKNIIKAFNTSSEIKLGYSTIAKEKGIVEPTMKRKSIYLTGGALRDHLKNKTFYNYDCVTDASPDEIRKILETKIVNLDEVKPETHDLQILHKEHYKKLPERSAKKNCFYASRWDKDGNEIELTAEIDGQKVFITPFSTHVKDRMVSPTKRMFATTMEEDAKTRDLTMNCLYLKLKNDDGENSELADPEGGIHDLKKGKIEFVGNAAKTLVRDPYLPFRICLLAARYSPDKKVPDNTVSAIKNIEGFRPDSKIVKRIFLAGLQNVDVPVYYFVKNLEKSDLMKFVFPSLKISDPVMELPNNKIVTIAYLLHTNDFEAVKNILVSNGYSSLDADNICKLIKLAHFANNSVANPELIYDLFTKPLHVSNSQIKEYLKLFGKHSLFDKLFDGKLDDIIKKYVETENSRQINPLYVRFMGKSLRPDELEHARKHIFHHKVKELLAN